jgi:hypothetical protein
MMAVLPSLIITNGQLAVMEASYTHVVLGADHLGRGSVV